jgi:hypothetical protein
MSKRTVSSVQRHKFQVINVAASPMNAKRWLCRLACGCEGWVTRAKRPTLGVTRLFCEQGHRPQEDPMPNGPLVCDLTESDGAR